MYPKTLLLCVATLLITACGSGEQSETTQSYATGQLATAEDVQQQTDLQAASNEGQSSPTVRRAMVGKDISPEGEISEAQRTEEFAPGEPIYVSVEVAEAAPHTPVKVAWYGPDDTLLREDTKEISQQDKYVHFAAEENQDWNPGEYRAEIWVRDQKVNEQRFAVVHRGSSTRRDSGS